METEYKLSGPQSPLLSPLSFEQAEYKISLVINANDWTVSHEEPKPQTANQKNKLLEKLHGPEYVQTIFLGFDLKLSPTGSWFIIEINGRHSGLKGLELADESFTENQYFKKARDKFGLSTPSYFPADPVVELLTEQIVKMILKNRGKSEEELKKLFKKSRPKLVDRMFEAEEKLTTFNDESLEYVIEDKIDQKQYLPQELITPFFYVDFVDNNFTTSQICLQIATWHETIISTSPEIYDSNYLVVKHPNGAMGKDVRIIRTGSVFSLWTNIKHDHIIEPYVRSIPIDNDQTGRPHDACLRFGTIADINIDGQVTFFHAGGYWRLAPEPTDNDDAKINNRFKANLSRRAIPQKARAGDLMQAQSVVEYATLELLSNYYERDFTKAA